MSTTTKPVLTFVHWYTHDAVYLGDTLMHFGENTGRNATLLWALGYACMSGADVPTCDIPREFDRAANGWWQPPQSLAVLQEQFALWRARQREERIAALDAERARLVGEKA